MKIQETGSDLVSCFNGKKDFIMIKALFFDMDGTLVAYPPGEIPLSARKALEKLREQGILICAATGRHRVEMDNLPFLKTLSFDAVAALNGQYCYTENQDLFINTLAPQDVATYFSQFDAPCIVSEKRKMYINRLHEGFRQAVASFATDLPPLGSMANIEEREILQLQVFCDEQQAKEIDAGLASAKTTRWSPEFVDLIPKTGGKTKGIEAILQHFNISWDEVMAFGDGENDLAMLETAAIGVAMGNAANSLKENADYITAAASEDGVALALEHFFKL